MKCPKCGCEAFAKISYGLPPFDDDFHLPPDYQKRIDNKEIILGGCCIFPNSPKYMCLECHFKYGSEPFYISDEENAFKNENFIDLRTSITEFYYSCGGFHQRHKVIIIKKTDEGIKLSVNPPFFGKEKAPITISEDQWDAFLNRCLSECLLHEWDDEYDSDILDGTQWSVRYTFHDKSRKIYGSNVFPPYWEMFQEFIEDLEALYLKTVLP